jgi:hypothetical protein
VDCRRKVFYLHEQKIHIDFQYATSSHIHTVFVTFSPGTVRAESRPAVALTPWTAASLTTRSTRTCRRPHTQSRVTSSKRFWTCRRS